MGVRVKFINPDGNAVFRCIMLCILQHQNKIINLIHHIRPWPSGAKRQPVKRRNVEGCIKRVKTVYKLNDRIECRANLKNMVRPVAYLRYTTRNIIRPNIQWQTVIVPYGIDRRAYRQNVYRLNMRDICGNRLKRRGRDGKCAGYLRA